MFVFRGKIWWFCCKTVLPNKISFKSMYTAWKFNRSFSFWLFFLPLPMYSLSLNYFPVLTYFKFLTPHLAIFLDLLFNEPHSAALGLMGLLTCFQLSPASPLILLCLAFFPFLPALFTYYSHPHLCFLSSLWFLLRVCPWTHDPSPLKLNSIQQFLGR